MTTNRYEDLPINISTLEWDISADTFYTFYAKQNKWEIQIGITDKIDIISVTVSLRKEENSPIVYGSEPGECHINAVDFKINEMAYRALTHQEHWADPERHIKAQVQRQISRDMLKKRLQQ